MLGPGAAPGADSLAAQLIGLGAARRSGVAPDGLTALLACAAGAGPVEAALEVSWAGTLGAALDLSEASVPAVVCAVGG